MYVYVFIIYIHALFNVYVPLFQPKNAQHTHTHTHTDGRTNAHNKTPKRNEKIREKCKNFFLGELKREKYRLK